MSEIIRKILNQTKNLAPWKLLIKYNLNLAKVMSRNIDLKLEELRLERTQLEEQAKTLLQKQRSIESMITDLTRSIKQMEYDLEQNQKMASERLVEGKETRHRATNREQK